MPTVDEFLANYKKHTTDITRLERAIEVTKKTRSDTMVALVAEHGKGPYDLGDGEAMIVATSKTGTCFFTPKDKWKHKKAGVASKKAKKTSAKGVDAMEGVDGLTVAGETNGAPVEASGPGVIAPEGVDTIVKPELRGQATMGGQLDVLAFGSKETIVRPEPQDPLEAALAEATRT